MSRGYLLSAPDNDSFMLRGPTPHPTCDACGLLTDREWIEPRFQLSRRDLDLSFTYDGYLIASRRFADFASERGARCVSLPSEPGYRALLADHVLAFDAARRRTRFENRCESCGRYRDVAGATPVLLVGDAAVPEAFARTDIKFGSGDEQHPLILVGPRLGAELRAGPWRGLDLVPVP